MPVEAIPMARDKGDSAASEQKVEAVERALTILDAFGDGSASLSLGELAERTNLYRSTILRLAASLERFGYLNRGVDGRFRLGPTLWRLGVQYQNAFNLADYVRPVLQELVAATGETAAFYVREGDRRICLYRQHASRLIGHHLEEGADLPLDRGASARILVAFTDGKGAIYDRVRDTGLYVSKGERDADTAAIAVPVFGRGRAFVGALGVTGPISRFDDKRIKTMGAVLSSAAQKLSKTIGGG
jgi:DNA-binding IclR family transcriptional regulator